MGTNALSGITALAELRGLLDKHANLPVEFLASAYVILVKAQKQSEEMDELHRKKLRELREKVKLLLKEAGQRRKLAGELAKLDEFGLYTKKVFEEEKLPKFLRNYVRDRRDVEERRSDLAALWILDIDKLKLVNDRWGIGPAIF